MKEKISCFDEKNDAKQGTPDLKAGISALLRTKYFYITVSVFVATFIINGIFLSTAFISPEMFSAMRICIL